jgi:hypothetical protein
MAPRTRAEGWATAFFALAAGCSGAGATEQEADVYVPAPADATVESAPPPPAPDASAMLGQVDRAGHPLANVLFVPTAHQDLYNEQSSYGSVFPRTLQDALESRLVFWDTIAIGDAGPDPVDWPIPEGGTHPLLPMFLTDVLLVDTSLPCTGADGGFAASYLDIEREIYLGGSAHTTCGGRAPNDDIVATTVTLAVTADRDGGPTLGRATAGPTKAATTTFPYLATPN